MPTIYEECARLVTLRDHLDMETEGSLTPAQRAANDTPPTELDLSIAQCETLLAIKLAETYRRKLFDRLDHVRLGRITPMPELRSDVPKYLQSRS